EQHVSPFDEDIVFADRWFARLSEPVRIRPALPVPEQHVFAFAPAPIISIAWHQRLAEPVRSKSGFATGLQLCLTQPAWPDISLSWFRPWHQPYWRPTLYAVDGAGAPGELALGEISLEVTLPPLAPLPRAVTQDPLAFNPFPLPFLAGGGGWY